jgi:hypothetical protein
MTRSHLRVIAAALCLTALAAAAAHAAGQARSRRVATLPDVQKIYIGDMGADDEADRFRLLLEEQLLKRGFSVVLRPEDADATVTGVLTVRTYDDKSEARATVRLVSPSGEVLWAKDFGHKRFSVNPFSLQEPTRRRAEEVAEALRRELRRPTRPTP